MTLNQIKEKLNTISSLGNHSECAIACRSILMDVVDFIFDKASKKKPKNASLLELLDHPVVVSYLNDDELLSALHYVRRLGMTAQQGRAVRKKESKIAQDNVTCLVQLIESKETGKRSYTKPTYMSEAATRRLYVDQYLREAGWDILDVKNVPMPCKAGIEIEVQGMPNSQGVGYCDYVLYGRDGKPLAIVEVKKTSESPEKGRHQADLYGECMEKIYGYKPVLYYTNGYVTKIIDGIYTDRTVMAFHTLEDLELMIQRRKRGNITDLAINKSIAGYPYQIMAVTNICDWLNHKHRRGLLVMATGTGKTRVSVSLVDILSRNNWVKNVLFLADRTALVHQAKKSFTTLLPNMSVCELSGNDDKDYNARLMFCTYQTMINYIDAEDKRFSAGRFDLIIIDEAHRSIFNRYGSIFKYFDSLMVGLTATPKNEIDKNTYQIFDCEAGTPNFDYSLEDAIRDHYLVGYRAINRTSQMLQDGIDYKALTDDEREQLDEFFEEDPPTPDFNIPGNEIFKHIFNKNTCCQVLEELMRWGMRVDGGETIGKTIIFAYNHKHAQMIVDCFHNRFQEYDPNTCQLVDYQVSYADNLVEKFKEDKSFRIAVSVDMLDTGVDVPEILNLVFFKKVRSKIKYVQMIGRGTRLCKGIYGPGKDKNGFLIFDYCGNLEYFGTHPDGKEGKEALTLSQRLFGLRLDMLYSLQAYEHQADEYLHDYYDRIKDELHGVVKQIKAHDSRIQVREYMQYVDKYLDLKTWVNLSPVMVKEAKKYLTPLIDSGLNGEYLSVAFDVRMFIIEEAILESKGVKGAANDVKTVRKIAKYLLDEKASVPQVLAKSSDLKAIRDDAFWDSPSVKDLEEKRISLRELMPFLAGGGKKSIEVDIVDVIEDSEYQVDDTTIDIRTYREKVVDYLMEHLDSEVIRKIHNLEPITNSDLDELEEILWHELGSRQDYDDTTDISNLAAFVRSLIGLSQDAVNEKFGDYLSGNTFNPHQQEFVRMIINYARENGDIDRNDIVNTEPFNNYSLTEMFGDHFRTIVSIVDLIHSSIQVAA